MLTALGERVGALPSRRVLPIEDFTPAQIRAYLVGRYNGDEQAADERLRLLSGIQDLLGLSTNPRMLSFISELDESRLRAVAGMQQTISAAALYEEILSNWLSHEEQRTQGVPGAPAGRYRPALGSGDRQVPAGARGPSRRRMADGTQPRR